MASPSDHRILIAGGGIAGLEALVALRAVQGLRARIDLHAASPTFAYRSLTVGEPFGFGHPVVHELAPLCAELGATFAADPVVSIDAARGIARTAEGTELGYDSLLLAPGARPYPAFEHGVAFDRHAAPAEFDELLDDLRAGFAGSVAIVVPDGVTWTLPAYELALHTVAWARARGKDVQVSLVTYEADPVAVFGSAASHAVAEALAAEGVTLHAGASVEVESDTALRIGGSQWIEAQRIVHLPFLTGPAVQGAPSDDDGFIPVDAQGRVPGDPALFAAGDGAALPIKQGGLAAQVADAAAAQIARRAGVDIEPRPARMVLRGLLRTSHGPLYLRAELRDPEGTSIAAREPLWWPPSKVASRWLAGHLARREALTRDERHLTPVR